MADEKAKRIIQGVIRETAIGQTVDNNLAAALAAKIVTALRTVKDGPTQRPARRPAFMAVPGADGQTVVEKVVPTPVGSQPRQAEEKEAFVKGDNVDREDTTSKPMTTSFEDLIPEDEEE